MGLKNPLQGRKSIAFTGVKFHPTGMSMEVSKWLVSWFITHLGDLQPTYIWVIIHLLSTMDTLVLIEVITYNSIFNDCRGPPIWQLVLGAFGDIEIELIL